MRFYDIPTALPREVYNQAVQHYASRTIARARAIYQVGSVSYPGLSDIDLIVVIDRAWPDSKQYFSVFERLPARLRKLFLHEPFILPADMLDLIVFTSHAQRRLVAGEDVIRSRSPLESKEEHWCKLFESYCNYRAYLDNAANRSELSARLLVAVANSFRYALADLDEVQSSHFATTYANQVDLLRTSILHASGEVHDLLDNVQQLFSSKMTWLTQHLSNDLQLSPSGDLDTYAKQFLAGEHAFGDLDTSYIQARKALIDTYYSRLRELALPYGSLFYAAGYSSAGHRYHQPTLVKIAAKVLYRLQR